MVYLGPFLKSAAPASPFYLVSAALSLVGYKQAAISSLAFAIFHHLATLTFCFLKEENSTIVGLVKENSWLIKKMCPGISVIFLVASLAISYFSFALQIIFASACALMDAASFNDKLIKLRRERPAPIFSMSV